MKRWRRVLLMFLAVEALFAMAVSLIYQIQPLHEPFGGFFIQWNWRSEKGEYIVHFSNSTTWEPLRTGQIAIGDRIISINGRSPAEAQSIYEHVASQPTPHLITYEILHNGEHRTVTLPLTTYTLSMLLEAALPFWMLSIGLWLLGLIVLRAQPDDPVNWRFAATAFLGSTVIALFNSNIRSSDLRPFESLILMLVWAPSGPIMGGLMVQLVALFPVAEPRSLLYRTRNVWLALAMIVVLFYETAIIIMLQGQNRQWTVALTYVTENMGLLLVVIALLLAGMRYSRLLRQSPSRKIRRQLMLVSLSCLVGLLVPLLPYVLYRLLDIWPPGLGNNNLPFLTFIFLVGVAYAILRYQLFQARSQVLSLMTGAINSVALAYLSFLILSAIPGFQANLASLLVATTLTTLIARKDSPSRRKLRRVFSRETEDYRVIEEFSGVLEVTPDSPRMQRQLLNTINHALELEWSALWQMGPQGRLALAQAAGQPCPELPDELLASCLELADDLPVRLGLADEPARRWMAILPTAAVVVPLRHQGELLGLLTLGPRWTEEVFDDDDVRLLHLLGRQVTLLLVAQRQLDELRQIPQRMARVQERERERISQELHDSTQQFLGSLPFRLATIQLMIGQAAPAAVASLAECQQEIKRASDELRALRRNLSPGPLLERGLRGALEALAEQHRRRSGLRIDLEIDPRIDRAIVQEQRHLLYRILQQALDNALIHARPTRIEVQLLVEDGWIRFSVADDGCGFDTAQLSRLAVEGHDGLRFMRDRVEALGGWLEIKSTLGWGTTIRGAAPLSPAGRDSREAQEESQIVTALG